MHSIVALIPLDRESLFSGLGVVGEGSISEAKALYRSIVVYEVHDSSAVK
jgi:hypothetical protein